MMGSTADAFDDRERLSAPTVVETRAQRYLHALSRPLPLGVLMSILGLNLLSFRPILDIDSSFRVGLTQTLTEGLPYGHDIAWPYGPLGFLAGPTMLSRGLLAVGMLYQLAILTVVLAVMASQMYRCGLSRLTVVLTLVPFSVALSVTENLLPEFVAVAVIVLLAAWRQAEPSTQRVLSPAVVACLGGVLAGVQLLVKFSTGFVVVLAVLWYAAANGSRIRDLAIALASVLATALGLWVLTGQRMGDLLTWIADSLDLAAGYQDAQAAGPDSAPMVVIGAALALPIGVAALGAYRWIRRDGRSAAWQVVLITLVAWFVLKQGLIRWDRWHVLAANLLAALLTLAIPWERKSRLLPVAVICMMSFAILAGSTERLRPAWTDRVDAIAVLVAPGRHADEIAQAREDLRNTYALPAAVVAALEGRTVHAEQWDIGALWAHEFQWSPLPSFQTYSTYTTRMDELNRDRLESPDGPSGVLLNNSTVDHRNGVWESPDARVALTCNFAQVAGDEPWFALQRTANHCGAAQLLETVTVKAGESVEIPQPSDPNSLVVAHFDVSGDLLRQLLKLVARPIDYPSVTVDGDTEYRLVLGTAGGAHLVRSPGRIGADALPHGELAHTSLSFGNIGGDIVVRFEEIPLIEG
jgi:hypothetical protein